MDFEEWGVKEGVVGGPAGWAGGAGEEEGIGLVQVEEAVAVGFDEEGDVVGDRGGCCVW